MESTPKEPSRWDEFRRDLIQLDHRVEDLIRETSPDRVINATDWGKVDKICKEAHDLILGCLRDAHGAAVISRFKGNLDRTLREFDKYWGGPRPPRKYWGGPRPPR